MQLLLGILFIAFGAERLISAYLRTGTGEALSTTLLLAYLGLGAGLMLVTLAGLSLAASERRR